MLIATKVNKTFCLATFQHIDKTETVFSSILQRAFGFVKFLLNSCFQRKRKRLAKSE